jgi:hypothetical protein
VRQLGFEPSLGGFDPYPPSQYPQRLHPEGVERSDTVMEVGQ